MDLSLILGHALTHVITDTAHHPRVVMRDDLLELRQILIPLLKDGAAQRRRSPLDVLFDQTAKLSDILLLFNV